VLGLSASLAGFAVAVALIVDAVNDPLVGRWSDRLHSGWGRRHPFLYVSILPSALLYFLIWSPPDGLSQLGLFAYLLTVTIALRFAITLFDIPMNALVPEVTSDYDERTSLLNDRISTSYWVGTGMSVLMYAYWLADSPEFPNGILRATGYVQAGLLGAGLVFVGTAVAALGSHAEIPRLRRPPAKRSSGFRTALFEYYQAMADRSVVALVIFGVIANTATGAYMVLWVYIQTYFWELTTAQLGWIVGAQLLGPVLAFVATPVLTRGRNKRSVMIRTTLLLVSIDSGPILLRVLGWFPGNHSPLLFPLLLSTGILSTMLTVIGLTLNASMVADLVELRELATGRREEGVLSSVQTFIRKAAYGLGAWLAGVVLDVIHFPRQAAVVEVPARTIFELGVIFGPILILLYLLALAALALYRIDRAGHVANLAALARTADAAQPAAGGLPLH
jgi:glycoside/pentoside/hexuronide:cation symporter, GPH family